MLETVLGAEWKVIHLVDNEATLTYIKIGADGIMDRDKGELIAKWKNITQLLLGKTGDSLKKNPWAMFKPHEMFFSICRHRKFKVDRFFDFAVKDRRTRKAITYQILQAMADAGFVPKTHGVFMTRKFIKRIKSNSKRKCLAIKFGKGTFDEAAEQKKYIEAQRSDYLASKLLSTMDIMAEQRASFEREIDEVRRSSTMTVSAPNLAPEDLAESDSMKKSLMKEQHVNKVMQKRVSDLEAQLQVVKFFDSFRCSLVCTSL